MNHLPSPHHQARSPTPGATERSTQSGLSLVEFLCSLAIMALLMGGALPLFDELRWSQALQSAASLLETDLHHARSLAVISGRPVRLSIQAPSAGGSCYVVHTGAAHACRCDGRGQAQCEAGAELLRLAEQPVNAGIRLAPVNRSILFDGGKGTVTPTATLKIIDPDGRTVHQVVNIMGRVRTCAVGGSLGGLRPCI
ncbi:MAG: GspH/FimT family pseudopilin [Microbacteriaceae bacterium]|nr:GspH/FimT family pseudopilin [Burkholderiaceae bacterium]